MNRDSYVIFKGKEELKLRKKKELKLQAFKPYLFIDKKIKERGKAGLIRCITKVCVTPAELLSFISEPESTRIQLTQKQQNNEIVCCKMKLL